jgi:hypothetical protein
LHDGVEVLSAGDFGVRHVTVGGQSHAPTPTSVITKITAAPNESATLISQLEALPPAYIF